MHRLTFLLLIFDWLIVLFWIAKTISTLRNFPRVPNLLDARYAQPLEPSPRALISVIVPACNEAANIAATLRALLAIDSVPIHIIAVDDRSIDSTGVILDELAAESHSRLTVVHVTELPAGWLGKPHAMALAAREATTPWLLFTDADVLFAPDVLLRALNFAEAEHADHVVLFPTMILKTFGERMMIAVSQIFGMVFFPAWRVPDPERSDSIGIGAFNLVRADVYRAVGGFESLRMQVTEDLRLGVEVKRAGYRQRVAFGPDLILIRWAEGAGHFIRNVTKNFFAFFGFRIGPALAACAVLAVLCIAPFAGLFGAWTLRIPAALIFVMLLLLYRCLNSVSRVPVAFFITFPIAAALLVYALLRSVCVTIARGGIRWRGTFYPLSELRKTAGRTF
jgi:glycosyltransferase involved in cell wall biosynthesis